MWLSIQYKQGKNKTFMDDITDKHIPHLMALPVGYM